MKFNDWFDITAKIYKEESIAEITVRILGVDFSIAIYGNLKDWMCPFCFLPGIGIRGILFQILFVGLYVGRLQESYVVNVREEAEVDQEQNSD